MGTSYDEWTFFSNYAHVLLLIAEDNEIRVRELSQRVGVTERAVQRILAVLSESGYIIVDKDGRKNRYKVDESKHLKHAVESHITIGELIRFIRKDHGSS